jgi:hypothetical protein
LFCCIFFIIGRTRSYHFLWAPKCLQISLPWCNQDFAVQLDDIIMSSKWHDDVMMCATMTCLLKRKWCQSWCTDYMYLWS